MEIQGYEGRSWVLVTVPGCVLLWRNHGQRTPPMLPMVPKSSTGPFDRHIYITMTGGPFCAAAENPKLVYRGKGSDLKHMISPTIVDLDCLEANRYASSYSSSSACLMLSPQPEAPSWSTSMHKSSPWHIEHFTQALRALRVHPCILRPFYGLFPSQ